MSMVITNNVSALNTQRWLTANNNALSSSLEKLSSGYRINTAADDPAGLIISEQLRAQNTGLERAVQNTEEASNVIGIAEGAMTEMNEILSSIRELAIAAANSGVTTSEQVVADQAEMDSAIETIDRIATTTKYSDQYLLNGSMSLSYDIDTTVDSVNDTDLLDEGMTDVYQILRTDYSVNVSFSGATTNAETAADTTVAAQRAYIEATGQTTGVDMDANDAITEDQEFTITGLSGSSSYSFSAGQHIGEIAETINNDANTTGVGAQLVFDSNATATQLTTVDGDLTNLHGADEALAYNFDSTYTVSANGVDDISAISGVSIGSNTDGDGRVYLKWDGAGNYTAYKDAELTQEVGTGAAGSAMSASNNSGLGLTVDDTATAATAGSVTIIDLGYGFEEDSDSAVYSITGIDLEDATVLTGVSLGDNTDATGNIYMKIEVSSTGTAVTISLYNDSSMSSDSLVSQGSATGLTNNADSSVQLYDVNAGQSDATGLYGVFNLEGTSTTLTDGTYEGTISFTDLGMRLYSSEYGSESYVKVEASEGALFTDADGNLVDAGTTGTEVVDYGQDAIVTVNGQKVTLSNGTSGSVSTSNFSANLVFDEGELGNTTIAVAGYDVGAYASAISEMSDDSNYATQAIRNTTQTIDNFTGGMQLQLGEGAGDNERTVYSIESMTADNLGQIAVTQDYDGDGSSETKVLSLSDCVGGGYADLATDPVQALEIIDQAIDDVTSQRARLGATQANLLETNINSLTVAIENITATESAIRDVDMASETTEYTASQILVQSATAMLAQANTLSQNVLSLLG